MANGAMASSSKVTPMTVEGIDFEDKGSSNIDATGIETKKGAKADGGGNSSAPGVQRENITDTRGVKGPGNAGVV